jgi:hypothetical protein
MFERNTYLSQLEDKKKAPGANSGPFIFYLLIYLFGKDLMYLDSKN